MSTQQITTQTERAELIISVDDERTAEDNFKLSTWLRTPVVSGLAELRALNSAASLGQGNLAGASQEVRAGLDRLDELLHEGYRFIAGIPGYKISDADRLATFVSYGWESGKIGLLNDARIEDLANRAISVTPEIADPDWRYPDELLGLISEQLARVNAFQPVATGGPRSETIANRNASADRLQSLTNRVRFYYCAASPLEDKTPELRKIGRQPRRSGSGNGAGGEPGSGVPTIRINWEQVGLDLHAYFEMAEGLEDVTNVLLVEGEAEFSTGVVLEPGQSQLVVWEGMTIEGELDELVLRDAENEVLARGVRDETLPNPGP